MTDTLQYIITCATSHSEAPLKLAHYTTAVYSSRLASKNTKETKVIPPDCFLTKFKGLRYLFHHARSAPVMNKALPASGSPALT